MASTAFSVSTNEKFEFGGRNTTVNGGNEPQYVQGSTITFTNTSLSDASVTFYNLSSLVWTNTAQFTLAPNQSTTRVIKADAPTANTSSVLLKIGSTYIGNGIFSIISGVDSTPDPFSLGPDQSGLEPNVEVFLPSVLISDISGTTVAVSTLNMQFRIGNDTVWRTSSSSLSNNTRLYCRAFAAAGYNTLKTCRLTISNVFDEVVITTAASPNQGTYVPFPRTTVPISLGEVIQFFGGSPGFGPPTNMLAYFKGSAFVPDIPQNSEALRSAPIKLTDFLGSGTTFYFVRPPEGRSIAANTVSSAQTIGLRWTSNANGTLGWEMGYSPSMTTNTQYRFEVTALESFDGSTDLPTITPVGYGTYSTSNNYIDIAATSGQNTEKNYRGKIKIFAKSSYAPTVITTHEFNYSLYFFGP